MTARTDANFDLDEVPDSAWTHGRSDLIAELPNGVRALVAYSCDQCETLHKYEFEAKDCCKPEVSNLHTFLCEACGTYHRTLDAAKECASRHEEQEDIPAHLRPVNPLELERHGQLRLQLELGRNA